MTIWTSRDPRYCNADAHKIGMMPSSGVIGAAHASLLYHVNCGRAGQIMTYIGGNNKYVASPSADNYFHVPFPQMIHPDDSDSKLRFFAIIFQAYADAQGTPATMTINADSGTAKSFQVDTSATNTADEGPTGITYSGVWSQNYDATHSYVEGEGALAYNCMSIRIQNVYVGALSVFEITPNKATLNTLTGRDFSIHPASLGGGMPMLGYDATANATRSVGTILQNQRAREQGYDSLVSSSRRCLFSWCHPQGIWIPGTEALGSWEYVHQSGQGDGVQVRCYPRPLQQYGTLHPKKVDLVVVARGDTGTKIAVHLQSFESHETHEIALDSTNSKLYVSTGLASFTGVSYFLADFQAFVLNNANVVVQAVQLWESEEWDDDEAI